MRWTVLITDASGVSEPEVVVDAATWERALRLVADAPSGSFAGWSVELTPQGWKVVDPVSKARYFLRSEQPAAGNTVSILPPANPSRAPRATTDLLVEAPAAAAPRRALRIPRTSEITMRRAAATKDAPYTYVESGLLVPLGTNEHEAEAALRAKFEDLLRTFAPGEAYRVVLGAFDEYFVGTPHTRAIAELDARSWQPPVRVQFPAQRAATTGGAAQAIPVGGSLPPPARENPDVGPFSVPKTHEARHAAAEDLFLGPARAPALPSAAPAVATMPLHAEPRVLTPAPRAVEPQIVRHKSAPSIPPPLPSHLASATVALNADPPAILQSAVPSAGEPHTDDAGETPLWDAAHLRGLPTALDGVSLIRAWLEHTSMVLRPTLAYVHCFDLAQADFLTVAGVGAGAAGATGGRLKSTDAVLASALRASGLVDVPALRARNSLRFKSADFGTTVAVSMAGAGRVLGVVEFALASALRVERRRELDASVRALALLLDRRGIHLDTDRSR